MDVKATPSPATISYPEKIVFVWRGYGEAELRERLKCNGCYWNPDKKTWHPSYRKAMEPGLEKRVLDDELPF